MTSEVVVMNRLGIAMASDSAATVDGAGRSKVYHADKLFMLSQKHPVGVMVYNNSTLLGVPWETIIKMCRRELANQRFDSLEGYANYLIEYLGRNTRLFPPNVQKDHYLELVESLFKEIAKKIGKKLSEMAFAENKLQRDAYKLVATQVILETRREWNDTPDFEQFDGSVGKNLAGQCSPEIHALTKKIFNLFEIAGDASQALHEIAGLIVSKDKILDKSHSGIVVAGFGDKEHFPVMKEYEFGDIFLNKLKYRCVGTEQIDSKNPSVVKPFAESGMALTFLNGISPGVELQVVDLMADAIIRLRNKIIAELPRTSDAKKREIAAKVSSDTLMILREIVEEFELRRQKSHLDPILKAMEYLPKGELAHVAASLVSLNAFQQRMQTNEDESVGGPIDVAVISKGDGFVWIERKHYFRRELNHHFFRNYGETNEAERGSDDQPEPKKHHDKSQ